VSHDLLLDTILATPPVEDMSYHSPRQSVSVRPEPNGEGGMDLSLLSPHPTRLEKWILVFDLLGVFVFAVSGTLAAGRSGLDWLGTFVIAAVTAIGGGTVRDMMLGNLPLFWIKNTAYTYVIVLAVASTMAVYNLLVLSPFHNLPNAKYALLVADAMGLGLFALCGAQVGEEKRLPVPVIVFSGTITGVGGGFLRDVMTDQFPLLLSKDVYATACVAGIFIYLLLRACSFRDRKIPRLAAFIIGIVVVITVRLLAIESNWQLPAFHIHAEL
jgi:uncharacterized membrane protein YeiH